MILFDEVIFGPVLSRRLGTSLGINLSTVNSKVCNFNCIYCECGWTRSAELKQDEIPTAAEFNELLEKRLMKLAALKTNLDSITFAGNGEPTLHPEFTEIIDRTIELRNKYFEKARVTVLSNATMIRDDKIINALKKVDINMLKLDAGTEKTFCLVNNPKTRITLKEIVDNLKKFEGKLTIQSLFLKGEHNGSIVDNTSDEEVGEWLNALKLIKPGLVVLYPISREPADKNVKKISERILEDIAIRVRNEGFKAEVYY